MSNNLESFSLCFLFEKNRFPGDPQKHVGNSARYPPPRHGWAPDPPMVGIRSPIGLVVGSCTSHPGVLGSIPKREEPGKTGAPCVKVPGSSRVPTLHCHWNVIAKHQPGSTPVQARGILQRPEEQSRTGSCQGSSVAGQPQCPRLWHSSTPNARFLSHSPSAPPPPFTQSPYPPRSLVRDGQTHPHRPRLVVSHSTCPPLSSSPHAHSFVIGPAVIKHTHTHLGLLQAFKI